MKGIIYYNLWSFLSGFFTQHVFRIHPCQNMCQYFILSYGWIKSIVWIDHFVYPSIADGHWDCSHFLSILNNAVMNLCVQVVCKQMFSLFLGVHPGLLGSGSYCNFMLNFWRNCQMVLQSGYTFLHSRQQRGQEVQSSDLPGHTAAERTSSSRILRFSPSSLPSSTSGHHVEELHGLCFRMTHTFSLAAL